MAIELPVWALVLIIVGSLLAAAAIAAPIGYKIGAWHMARIAPSVVPGLAYPGPAPLPAPVVPRTDSPAFLPQARDPGVPPASLPGSRTGSPPVMETATLEAVFPPRSPGQGYQSLSEPGLVPMSRTGSDSGFVFRQHPSGRYAQDV